MAGIGLGIGLDKRLRLAPATIQLSPPSGLIGASFIAGVAEVTWNDAPLCPFQYSVVVKLASDDSTLGSTTANQDVGFAQVGSLEPWSGQSAYFEIINVGNGGTPYLSSPPARSANFNLA